MQPYTVLAYIRSEEQIDRAARRTSLPFAKNPPGAAWHDMALEIYKQFKPLGPVRLHFIGINKVEPDKGHGMALLVGCPNQEPDQLPPLLLEWGVRVFGSPPRRVTRAGKKGCIWTSPSEDGKGSDEIIMVRGDPVATNWYKSDVREEK
ncbi:unnamed protein product [Rhizoctonia solani]|uniref:Uncharacterized protein n=1 Tax=Rhizoctonia solani TaxID=456999 RepID=A0A8H3H3X5_9AGAM|nr:unnamed protein product [Rhizoctonia solani]